MGECRRQDQEKKVNVIGTTKGTTVTLDGYHREDCFMCGHCRYTGCRHRKALSVLSQLLSPPPPDGSTPCIMYKSHGTSTSYVLVVRWHLALPGFLLIESPNAILLSCRMDKFLPLLLFLLAVRDRHSRSPPIPFRLISFCLLLTHSTYHGCIDAYIVHEAGDS